jgi:hypothetical protein
VNTKYVFVRDFAGKDQFLLEAAEGVRLSHYTLADHLNCNDTIQLLVVPFVYTAHTALAQK